MQDKKSFGKYILEKRKEAKLTQEELASKLYVIPTTISKWERGITYPDITMITKLCKELNISEHEFFMACDDVVLNQDRKEAMRFRIIKKLLFYLINIGYLIALVACFICNLVIDKTLSWFFIVVIGIFIAFSITTLPIYLKKNRYLIFKVSFILTILVYLLLFIVNYVYGGDWLGDGVKIASFVFTLVWTEVLIYTFTNISNSYKIAIGLVLLAVCTALTNYFIDYVCNIPNSGSNIPNIISSIVLVVLAIIICLKRNKD